MHVVYASSGPRRFSEHHQVAHACEAAQATALPRIQLLQQQQAASALQPVCTSPVNAAAATSGSESVASAISVAVPRGSPTAAMPLATAMRTSDAGSAAAVSSSVSVQLPIGYASCEPEKVIYLRKCCICSEYHHLRGARPPYTALDFGAHEFVDLDNDALTDSIDRYRPNRSGIRRLRRRHREAVRRSGSSLRNTRDSRRTARGTPGPRRCRTRSHPTGSDRPAGAGWTAADPHRPSRNPRQCPSLPSTRPRRSTGRRSSAFVPPSAEADYVAEDGRGAVDEVPDTATFNALHHAPSATRTDRLVPLGQEISRSPSR